MNNDAIDRSGNNFVVLPGFREVIAYVPVVAK